MAGRGPPRAPVGAEVPMHLGRIDRVFATFPGATVVHCHRDPATVIASFCSLVEQVRVCRGAKFVERGELGEYLLSFAAEDLNRNLVLRNSLPADGILDVSYEDINADAIGVVTRIYEARRMQLSAQTRAAMSACERENPKDRYGRHDYTLERYGLDRECVNHAFARYLERFPTGHRARA